MSLTGSGPICSSSDPRWHAPVTPPGHRTWALRGSDRGQRRVGRTDHHPPGPPWTPPPEELGSRAPPRHMLAEERTHGCRAEPSPRITPCRARTVHARQHVAPKPPGLFSKSLCCCVLQASPAGIEPATYCLGGSRSIQLSYGDKLLLSLNLGPVHPSRLWPRNQH